jgi:hypothetical protein
MIGGVKSRAFEHNAHWLIQFAQFMLPTFGTPRERLITELLSAIELHTAMITPVGVQGHVVPPTNGRLIRFVRPTPR